MRILTKALTAIALAASFAVPAFATVADDVRRAAATNGFINVDVRGDTVTLSGYVEDNYASQRAEQTAKVQGYRVHNYLLISNL